MRVLPGHATVRRAAALVPLLPALLPGRAGGSGSPEAAQRLKELADNRAEIQATEQRLAVLIDQVQQEHERLTEISSRIDRPDAGHAPPPGGAPPPFDLADGDDDVGAAALAKAGALAGVHPGTPPHDRELAGLSAAAAAKQRELCASWPDNRDCMLLAGPKGQRGQGPMLHPEEGEAALERALAWKIVLRDEPFNFRVLGSSASAGHGAHFNSSYAITTMMKLRPVFAQIGVEFRGDNQAMGGYDFRPGTLWCQSTLAGEDVDLLTWEWGLFGPDFCSLETYLRSALSLPRRPPVMFIGTSGPGSGGSFWGEVFFNHGRSERGKAAKLVERIMKVVPKLPIGRGGDASGGIPCGGTEDWDNLLRDGKCLEDWAVKQGQGRQSDPVFEEAIDIAGVRKTKDPHTYPRQNANLVFAALSKHYGPTFGAYELNTGSATNMDWQPWWLYRHVLLRASHHPGTLGHVLISHQIAHWFLDRLIAAVALARREAAGHSLATLAKRYRKERELHRASPLPAPKWCSKPGLEADHGRRHRCWTGFRPRMDMASSIQSIVADKGKWSVGDMASGQLDDGRSYRDHKLVTAIAQVTSKDDQSPLRLKMRAPAGAGPPGSTTGKIDVALCLFEWAGEQRGVASCGGGKPVCVSWDKKRRAPGEGMTKCADAALPIAPTLGLPFTGAPPPGTAPGWSAADKLPPPGATGCKGTCGVLMTCHRVCVAAPGAEVELTVRPDPGQPMSITHVLMVDADSTSVGPPG